MKLSHDEMVLRNAACSNPENVHGQDLLNVFGAERAIEIVEKMTTIPLGVVVEGMAHLWHALNFEAERLAVPNFALVGELEHTSGE